MTIQTINGINERSLNLFKNTPKPKSKEISNSEEKCMICLNTFMECISEDIFNTLVKCNSDECNFISCEKCIKAWYNNHNTCPYCRNIDTFDFPSSNETKVSLHETEVSLNEEDFFNDDDVLPINDVEGSKKFSKYYPIIFLYVITGIIIYYYCSFELSIILHLCLQSYFISWANSIFLKTYDISDYITNSLGLPLSSFDDAQISTNIIWIFTLIMCYYSLIRHS